MRVVELTGGGLVEERDGVFHFCLWDETKPLDKPTTTRASFHTSKRRPRLGHLESEKGIVADIDLQQTLYRFSDGKKGDQEINYVKARRRGRR